MYESFFKLQRRPFAATPDPSCVYRADSIQTVIDEAVVCLERGEGIAVLTAPAGLGKTLLCERVKRELGAGFVTILLRHGNFSTPADLLRTLLAEMHVATSAQTEQELRLKVIASLTELRRRGELLAVICDEAHQLTPQLLEELRSLVDHADHGIPWVRLMLAGQLELEEKLAAPELSALNQRLRAHVSLPSLTAAEALDYIDYRITWAGGRTEEAFHPDALTAIVEAADGLPRCLNQLCDHVLLLAYVAEQQPAPPELVAEALSDLQHLPLSWNVRAARETSSFGSNVTDPAEIHGNASEPSVEFGGHLADWESSPSFSSASAVSSLPETEVWEFGSEDDETADDSAAEEFLSEEDSPARFVPLIESRLDRIIAREQELAQTHSGGVEEEPVIDRYAAIDGGWPDHEFPAANSDDDSPSPIGRDQQTLDADTIEIPPSLPVMHQPESAEPEQQLHSDVLELVTATQDAFSRRFDIASQQCETPPPFDDDSSESVETPSPVASPQRPFRNLFTRLRRKQKGLE